MRSKIRNRVSIFLAITIIVGGTFLVIDLKFYFNKLQTDIINQYVVGKDKAISQSVASMKTNLAELMFEYSIWDETYYNLKDENYTWVTNNVTKYIYTGKNYNMDFVYLENEDNSYKEYYGDEKTLAKLKAQRSWLIRNSYREVTTDLAYFNDNLFVICYSPIKTTDNIKKSGYMVFGKRIEIKDFDLIFKPYLGIETLNINYSNQLGYSNKYIKADKNVISMFYNLKDNQSNTIKTLNFNFDLSTYLKSLNATFIGILVVSLVLLAIMTVFIIYYISIVAKKMNELIDEIDRIAAGDYTNLINIKTKTHEFRRLKEHINNFATTISGKVIELENISLETIFVLVRAVEAKDMYTKGHSERVTKYSEIIGKEMNYEDIDKLKKAAILHDVGKISIKEELLHKPSALTEQEYMEIQDHSRIGFNILDKTKTFEDIKFIIRQHHEKFDGTGYPDMLSGEDIDLAARIISVADAFDAMTSDRPYRDSMPFETAIKIIIENSGNQFDPKVVEAFVKNQSIIYKAMLDYTEHDYLQIFL